jgi:hypothetical protein
MQSKSEVASTLLSDRRLDLPAASIERVTTVITRLACHLFNVVQQRSVRSLRHIAELLSMPSVTHTREGSFMRTTRGFIGAMLRSTGRISGGHIGGGVLHR